VRGPTGRTGTCGITRSTRWAAVSCMWRVVHEGQNTRPLQDSATNTSSPHAVQRTRKSVREDSAGEIALELAHHEPGKAPARCATFLHFGEEASSNGRARSYARACARARAVGNATRPARSRSRLRPAPPPPHSRPWPCSRGMIHEPGQRDGASGQSEGRAASLETRPRRLPRASTNHLVVGR
jgi:hypothetical protein